MTSPISSNACMTMTERAALSTQLSISVTLTWKTFIPASFAFFMTSRSMSSMPRSLPAPPDASPAAGAAAAPPAAGAAAGGGVPLEMELSLATRSETSTTSSASPLPTLSTICSSESRHLKRVSMMSSLSFSCSLRTRSRTSSISCVSSAIFAKPIVADMPFSV